MLSILRVRSVFRRGSVLTLLDRWGFLGCGYTEWMQPVSPKGDALTAVDDFLSAVEPALLLGLDPFLQKWTETWCLFGGARYAAVHWIDDDEHHRKIVASCRAGTTLPNELDQAAWWDAAQRQCGQGEPLLLHPDVPHPLQLGNNRQMMLLRPLTIAGHLRAMTVVSVESDQPPEGLQSVWDSAVAILGECAKSDEQHKSHDELRQLSELESLLSNLYTREGASGVAEYVAHAGAQWLGCDRLLVVHRKKNQWRVLAVTGVQRSDPRGDLIRSTTQLARVASEFGELIQDEGCELPPQVDGPLQEWIDASHLQQVVVVPCQLDGDAESVSDDSQTQHNAAPTESGTLCDTVVIAGCFASEDKVFETRRVVQLSHHIGRAIDREYRHESQPFAKWTRRLQQLNAFRLGSRQGIRLAVALILLTIAFLVLQTPVPFTIQVSGKLQPENRRFVFAPADGVVETVNVTHGDGVTSQQHLLVVKRNALRFDLARLEGQRASLLTQLDNLEKAGVRSAVGGDSEPSTREQNAGERRRIEKELEGLGRQISIAEDETQHLVLKSPFDGIVLSRRPEQRLAGRPVSAGDELMIVADLDGQWQLELECAEEDVRQIQEQFRRPHFDCHILFSTAANTNRKWPATLSSVERVAQVNHRGDSVVSMRANILDNQEIRQQWTPGMSVTARVYLGKRPLGHVLTRRAWNALRYKFLF